MNTKLLYQTDSYLKQFTAKVLAVQDGVLIFEQTAFYPGGGGQPDPLAKPKPRFEQSRKERRRGFAPSRTSPGLHAGGMKSKAYSIGSGVMR